MELSLPRGIRDIAPDEYDVHKRIRRAFEKLTRRYNFRAMEPAPLETLSILRAKSGNQVDEQIYHFQDKAGRDIGLRFDLTVGMTRYVVGKKELRPPIKLASYGGVWRYDEPQHARYRWFYQWDVEIFGDASIDSDVEVMDISYNFFKEVGLGNVTLEVGDRRVVEEYIRRRLRVSSEAQVVEMMRALDKVAKKTEEELIFEYERKGIGREAMSALLSFGRTKGPPDQVLNRLKEEGLGSASEGLVALNESLRLRGITNVEYNLSIVRGIDYYTAIVFEVVDADRPDLGSLCGGGRYDILPKLFDRPDLTAVGAAGGVERIALSLKPRGEGGEEEQLPSAYVAYTDGPLVNEATQLLSILRQAGVRSEIAPRGKRLGRQLEEASARGFRDVVIVGRRELQEGVFILRDLRERNEIRLNQEDLVSTLLRPR